MSNFPMLEKIGLKTLDLRDKNLYVVSAFDIEALLKSAQTIYGYGGQWSSQPSSNDTAMALIIDVKPIKKKTKAEAALEFVASMAPHMSEAKRILEMKDEV